MSFPTPGSVTSRRSFTLPARPVLRSTSQPATQTSSDGIETLFVCSNSKTVSFTATTSSSRPSTSYKSKAEEEPSRAIPWTSPTERTLAVGALRIYRVTASNVSFLNSGTLLHTIFPRSQCWCVDGQSIFVLRIRQDSYYRIELQYETQEDKDRVTHFTSVLAQVLQFEKTQSPFSRHLQPDIPDRPPSPPRTAIAIKRRNSLKAKKWLFDKTWVPESSSRPTTPSLTGSEAGDASSYDDDDRSSIHTTNSEAVSETPEVVSSTIQPKAVRRLSVAERANIFQGARSVTAPVSRSRTISVASMHRIPEEVPKVEEQNTTAEKPLLERHISEADSIASSADSFYSLSTSTNSTPTPEFLDAEAELLNPWATAPKQDEGRGRSIHRRHLSEATVRAPSTNDLESAAPRTPTAAFFSTTSTTNGPSSAPSTPPLVSDSEDDSLELLVDEVVTPQSAIRMKRLTGASQRRAFSPMPPSKNLFIPPPRPAPSRQFTNTLVRKTLELVLGPPAHLVSLMLRIAASISNGFGFSTYRVRQTEKLPCSWESDDEGDWPDEDDFGIPLNNLGESGYRRRAFSSDLD